MPLRPASPLTAGLAGLALAGLAAWPLLAQQLDNPADALRPGLDLQAPQETSQEAPETPAPETDTPEAPAAESTEAEPGGAPDAADLAALEASLSLSQERIDALKQEIAAMEGDRTQQSAALIAAAQRVKLAEIEVADVEQRLSDLIVAELEVRGRLDG